MSSRRILALVALMLPALFVVTPWPATAGPRITGVWLCESARLGSPLVRPVSLVFHSDGTLSYSSQSTVNGGPLSLPFTSRGGGHGEWEKLRSGNDYAYRTRENLYISGNAGGFLYVDAVVRLDPKTGQLCSGCPGAETRLRMTQFIFAADGSITGEVDLLPAGSQAQTVCQRLDAVFPALP